MDKIYPIAKDRNNLLRRIKTKLFSRMSADYDLDVSKFYISDLFLTKYDATVENRNMLAPHRDKSQWSFVISLNDDYTGGGTFFAHNQDLWKAPKAAALYFSGTLFHGGIYLYSYYIYVYVGINSLIAYAVLILYS
jgi:hypothetical protein